MNKNEIRLAANCGVLVSGAVTFIASGMIGYANGKNGLYPNIEFIEKVAPVLYSIIGLNTIGVVTKEKYDGHRIKGRINGVCSGMVDAGLCTGSGYGLGYLLGYLTK